MRNCSCQSSKKSGLTKLKARFLANGYPRNLVERHLCLTDRVRIIRDRQQSVKAKTYLHMPFIDVHSEQQIRATLLQCDLPIDIKPAFITGSPLSTQLQRNSPMPCFGPCFCQNRNLCSNKNIVYQVVCTVCNASYIGETHRTYKTRIREHVSCKNSNVYRHFTSHHNRLPEHTLISHRIRGSGYANTLQRKAHETALILAEKPLINVQHT